MSFIVKCNYCGGAAGLVRGRELYPHRLDLAGFNFYRCKPCDAHVGCHPGTERPLGKLATAALRKLRRETHLAFDPLWRSGRMTRRQAYAWLRETMMLGPEQCHIGQFDEKQCGYAMRAIARLHAEAKAS